VHHRRVQVLIYVGAVMVFMVAIMLLDVRASRSHAAFRVCSCPVPGAVLLLGVLVYAAWPIFPRCLALRAPPRSACSVLRRLPEQYWLHFELISDSGRRRGGGGGVIKVNQGERG
jgi:NADH:ubiquinone oxidoreductase subunit 6 (subunit J)